MSYVSLSNVSFLLFSLIGRKIFVDSRVSRGPDLDLAGVFSPLALPRAYNRERGHATHSTAK